MKALTRWFPKAADAHTVSAAWLQEHDRQAQRTGWEQAPSIDWTQQTFTGPRRVIKAEHIGGRFL